MPDKAGSQSRRSFVRKLSAGLGAAMIGGPAILGATTGSRPLRKRADGLGLALVGLGDYSAGQLGPALRETDLCYLSGIVTGTPEKAVQWMEEYGIPEANVYDYDSYDEIASNPDIDIVYIVLPNSMHAEYTIRAAEAGKHVIVEKPMANTVEECEAMIAACRRNDVKLSVGYRLHFDPFNQEMMRLGQTQVHGPVKVVEANFGFTIWDPELPRFQWRLDKELAGGGALMDVGIYAVQGARYVTGEEPVSVTAQEYETRPDVFGEVDETMFWQLAFPSGAVAHCGTSYNANFNRLFATAEGGWFELRPAYSYGGLSGWTHEGEMPFRNVNQQAAQMDDFARCVLEGAESRVSGEEGLRDMIVVEAIYEAARTGREVRIG
jgi:predicted dehydrogenase